MGKVGREVWKDVFEYQGIYKISSIGRVWSKPRRKTKGGIRKQFKDKVGYMSVVLSLNGVSKMFCVHRLVAQAFIFNPDNKSEVNHKDGDKQNNKISNLEWCTHLENMQHAVDVLGKSAVGENNGFSKLNNSMVEQIRTDLRKGKLQNQIANKFNVVQSVISDIKLNKRWGHLSCG